jgi:septal ring factor EnvC (AmiA/AmiB activator)
MTQAAIQHELILETDICCTCHIVFAMPSHMLARVRKTGETFYCPSGHSLVYNGGKSKAEKEAERLREMLEQANRSKTQLVADINEMYEEKKKVEIQLKRTKTIAKKTMTRIHAGVCPCCERTFQNLARHMAAKHKDLPNET